MPQPCNLDRATGRMFREDDSAEILFNAIFNKDNDYYMDDEVGWLLSEVVPYLNARLSFSRQENTSNDEQDQPPKIGVFKSILISQPQNTILNSVARPGRREQQYEIILAVITAFEFDPLQIPDNGKAKIKSVCLTRSRIFTDSGFGHAWKAGVAAGLFKLASHEKYFSK